jgi:hypothetical protein
MGLTCIIHLWLSDMSINWARYYWQAITHRPAFYKTGVL